MEPCCRLLVVEIRGSWPEVIILGPVFSSHVWSSVWAAITWPRVSPALGVMRCTIIGKYPSILEK